MDVVEATSVVGEVAGPVALLVDQVGDVIDTHQSQFELSFDTNLISTT